jgi:hypothetical protein
MTIPNEGQSKGVRSPETVGAELQTLDSGLQTLVTGPVLQTRDGCRRRVALLSLAERWALAWYFGIDVNELDCEDLARRLHALNHTKRTKRTHENEEGDNRRSEI